MILVELKAKREAIIHLASQYGASNVLIFGSVAHGVEREDSDIDLLVDFEPGRSLLDHAGLMLALEEMLGRHVDIGTTRGLLPTYRESILHEAIPL